MTKHSVIFLLVLLLLALPASAQKFGYVDSEYVLEQMPEYEAVQKEIEQLSQQWQKEIEEKYEAIDKKYQEYQAKEVLLSDEDKQRMQDEILEDGERRLKNFSGKSSAWTANCSSFAKKKCAPFRRKMMKAVEKVAKANRLNMIFRQIQFYGFIILRIEIRLQRPSY